MCFFAICVSFFFLLSLSLSLYITAFRKQMPIYLEINKLN